MSNPWDYAVVIPLYILWYISYQIGWVSIYIYTTTTTSTKTITSNSGDNKYNMPINHIFLKFMGATNFQNHRKRLCTWMI